MIMKKLWTHFEKIPDIFEIYQYGKRQKLNSYRALFDPHYFDQKELRFWTKKSTDFGQKRVQILDQKESQFWTKKSSDFGPKKVQILDQK